MLSTLAESARKTARYMVEMARLPETKLKVAADLYAQAAAILEAAGLSLDDIEDKDPGASVVVLAVDASHSMESRKANTIRATNSFIKSLAGELANQSCLMTVFQFNGSSGIKKISSRQHPAQTRLLDQENYVPNSSTPLYDAIADAIAEADALASLAGPKARITVAIQTDGDENTSVRFRGADGLSNLRSEIKAREAAGWQFIFLGAALGARAYETASGLGFARAQTMSYSDAAVGAAFANLGRNVGAYAKGAAVHTQFSAEQKLESGDACL